MPGNPGKKKEVGGVSRGRRQRAHYACGGGKSRRRRRSPASVGIGASRRERLEGRNRALPSEEPK